MYKLLRQHWIYGLKISCVAEWFDVHLSTVATENYWLLRGLVLRFEFETLIGLDFETKIDITYYTIIIPRQRVLLAENKSFLIAVDFLWISWYYHVTECLTLIVSEWWWFYALSPVSASKAIFRARTYKFRTCSVRWWQWWWWKKERKKRQKKETEIRKPLVASYDMPGIQWTYSIPGPTFSCSMSDKMSDVFQNFSGTLC